jgi:hypothetical protein
MMEEDGKDRHIFNGNIYETCINMYLLFNSRVPEKIAKLMDVGRKKDKNGNSKMPRQRTTNAGDMKKGQHSLICINVKYIPFSCCRFVPFFSRFHLLFPVLPACLAPFQRIH